jgi:metal-sulfur cluster biosynthetic enzyme
MVTKDKIMEILKQCYDPEIPINIVDLGLIYDVRIDRGNVFVKMTPTACGCPMSGFIAENVKQRIKALDGVNQVDVQLVWDPLWTPERINPEAKRFWGCSLV